MDTSKSTMVPPFYVDCLLGDPGKKEEEVVGFSQEGLQRATRGWGGDAEEKAVAFPAITLCYNYLKDSIHSMLLLGTFTLALLPSDELVKLLLLDFKSCITKESLHVSCKCVSWSLRAARSLTFWFKDGKRFKKYKNSTSANNTCNSIWRRPSEKKSSKSFR